MNTLTLAGNTPVLYFDPADDAIDGKGYNDFDVVGHHAAGGA